MTKTRVDLPEKFIFSSQYRVLHQDVNAANHLAAERLMPIAMETKFSFIRALGYEDVAVFEQAELIMSNATIDYLEECDYMELLDIQLAVTNIRKKSFEMIYKIESLDHLHEVARINTRLLFFDYTEKQVKPIPDSFLQKVNKFSC